MENSLIRRFCTIICATLLAMVIPRPGIGQVLVVQSSAVEVYQQAVSGFSQTFIPTVSLPGIPSIQPSEIIVLDPKSPDNSLLVTRKYQALQPKIIVAVGSLALTTVASLSSPIVYLLIPDPDFIVSPRPGLTGIRLAVAPAQQLAAIKKNFPASTRIGLLHNPASSVDSLELAHRAAASLGLTLVSIPAGSDREAILAVAERERLIDALLLTPEPTLISPTLLDALALFSLEKKIPLIAFAPKYLEQGVAMVVFATPEAMGRQAGQMARDSQNRPLSGIAFPEYATEATVLTNPRIMRKMGIPPVPPIANQGRLIP